MKLNNKPSKNVSVASQKVVRKGKGDLPPNQSLGGAYKEDPQTVADRIMISKAYQKKVSK